MKIDISAYPLFYSVASVTNRRSAVDAPVTAEPSNNEGDFVIRSEIRKIPINIARPFIEKWHYSKCCPTGKNIFFGWFIKGNSLELEMDLFSETLYAVIDYGIGINPQAANYLANETGKDVTTDNLLELTRLCRIEPKIDKLPLTKLISKCNKILGTEGYKYIVSYSDPSHGHTGGIYKAANFINLGKTEAIQHNIDRDGKFHHRRYCYKYAKRNHISMPQARIDLGLDLIKTLPKDRWFIQIDNRKNNASALPEA